MKNGKRNRKLPGRIIAGIGAFLLIWALPLMSCNQTRTEGSASDSPPPARENELDRRVWAFLNQKQDGWDRWNVPFADGRILYEMILKNKYKNVLEIGTSTGHSAIWMAWALSKTGGKLITIDIHKGRLEQAKANFKAAGLEKYIEPRLADAHELVKKLPGPFGLVFCDADKEWYINYFKDTAGKIKVGGIFAGHNVLNTGMSGIPEFNAFLKTRKDFKTTYNKTSRSGISISKKLR